MSLTIPLVFFGIFLVSLILIAATIPLGIWSEYKNKRNFKQGKGAALSLIFIYILVALSNIGWLGGIITLIIWGILQLSS